MFCNPVKPHNYLEMKIEIFHQFLNLTMRHLLFEDTH